MKAVVVALKNCFAAVLTEEGTVIKIDDNGYSIGQRIRIDSQKFSLYRPLKWVKPLLIAAASMLLFCGIGGGTAYAIPVGLVELEVNPAIEYQINCFDYVIGAHGANEEGEQLIAKIDSGKLLNRRIDEAVSITVSQLMENNYMDEEDNNITATVKTGNESHSSALLGKLEQLTVDADDEVKWTFINLDEVNTVKENEITAFDTFRNEEGEIQTDTDTYNATEEKQDNIEKITTADIPSAFENIQEKGDSGSGTTANTDIVTEIPAQTPYQQINGIDSGNMGNNMGEVSDMSGNSAAGTSQGESAGTAEPR